MKQFIDIHGNPKDGDMLIFNKGQYVHVPKEVVLNDVILLKKEVSDLRAKLRELTGKLLLDEGKITEEDFNNGNY